MKECIIRGSRTDTESTDGAKERCTRASGTWAPNRGKALGSIQRVTLTLVSGGTQGSKGMGCRFQAKVTNSKVNGKLSKNMVRESLSSKMVMFILVSSKTTNFTVKVNISIKMVVSMKAIFYLV